MRKLAPLLLLASALLARTELVHLRTATSRTFDNGDGTYTAEIHAGPIHRMDSQGEWMDLGTDQDTTVRSYQTGEIVHSVRWFWVLRGDLKYKDNGVEEARRGWAKFDLDCIPDSAALLLAGWHSYQFDCSMPSKIEA